MELGHSFYTLDELTQLILIFEHFDYIGIDNPLFYEDTQRCCSATRRSCSTISRSP